MSRRITAIVLAAGAGRRFGGGKLLATIDGRPILDHVLHALAAAGIDRPVVVVGPDAAAIEALVARHGGRIARNPDPSRGLSSSLKTGWAIAIRDGAPIGGGDAAAAADAAIVVLGDQPLLSPDVLRALVAVPFDPGRPIVIARHADGSRNPVRLEREAGPLVDDSTGDRGIGPLLDAHPELVREIDVGGVNPDVDTAADLVALLEVRWAEQVRANAAQVEEVRVRPEDPDFYATVRRVFVADPARDDDPVLTALLAEARPGERWLDIGAGAGRYALPIARRAGEVLAIDPSPSMLAALREGMVTHGIPNVLTCEGRWPPGPELRATLGPDPIADVALIAHVGYDIEAIGPFLDAMDASVRRECVAIVMEQSPASVAAPFWPVVHGHERIPLPALPQFLELLSARGAAPVVTRLPVERRRWADLDELIGFLRRQLWTDPGTAADDRLLAAVRDLTVMLDDGSIGVPVTPALDIGIVTWIPVTTD